MYLILGIGCSGKTSIGNIVSKKNLLTHYASSVGVKNINTFKWHKKVDLNNGYNYIFWFLKSSFFFNLSVLYFKKLLKNDIFNLKKLNNKNKENYLQVSLKSARVMSFLYSLDPKIIENSEIVNLLKQLSNKFDKVIVLHSSYSQHLKRVKERGETLFIYDSLILLNEEYEEKYYESNKIFASYITNNVLTINTNNFDEAVNTSIDYLKF